MAPIAPVTQPLIPENILNQQISLGTKNTEAALRDELNSVKSAFQTLNKFVADTLNPKPVITPPILTPEPAAKKSVFQELNDELNKLSGF